MKRMTDPRKMKHRISILRPAMIEDEIGQKKPGYEHVRNAWADIIALKGDEFIENEKVEGKQQYKIKLKYAFEISNDMIIEYKGKQFNITSAINFDEANREYHLICTERGK